MTYRKTSNISRTLVGNKIVDHSDVVGIWCALYKRLDDNCYALHASASVWIVRYRRENRTCQIWQKPMSGGPHHLIPLQFIKLIPTGAAYMRHWTGPMSLPVMASWLCGVKPLPEPILTYCELGTEEQTVNFVSKYKVFIHENGGYFFRG